jgi:NAD(P)-dependent dehydrogenase (short-subunit alcohol dehydrogenase family)
MSAREGGRLPIAVSVPSIFITGAARGIGRACAERFAAAGYRVGLYDIEGERLATTAAELGERYGHDRVCSRVLDVRERASIDAAIEHFAERSGGRMDVLLNNAGVMHVGGFETLEPSAHRQMIAVNVLGAIEVAQAGFALLSATPGARLINMSSAAAIYGMPEMATYSASKHAIRGLTEALELEWERFGIRVSDVMPIFVDTELLTGTRKLRASETLGIHLGPEDVAAVVWRAATDPRPRLHWSVGVQTRLAMHATGLVPSRLERWVVRLLTSRA